MSIYKKLFEIQKKNLLLSADADNPFFHSKYVSMENIVNTLKPLLEEQGLLLTHEAGPESVHGKVFIRTRVIDVESGEEVCSLFPINTDLDAQKIGASITYGKRYNTVAIFSLIEDDDDGNTASGKQVSTYTSTTPTHTAIPTKSNGFQGKFAEKAPPSRWLQEKEVDELISDIKSGSKSYGSSNSIIKEYRDKGVGVSKKVAEYITEKYVTLMVNDMPGRPSITDVPF